MQQGKALNANANKKEIKKKRTNSGEKCECRHNYQAKVMKKQIIFYKNGMHFKIDMNLNIITERNQNHHKQIKSF